MKLDDLDEFWGKNISNLSPHGPTSLSCLECGIGLVAGLDCCVL